MFPAICFAGVGEAWHTGLAPSGGKAALTELTKLLSTYVGSRSLKHYNLMGAFLYRCPNTGHHVQGSVADDPTERDDDAYEAATTRLNATEFDLPLDAVIGGKHPAPIGGRINLTDPKSLSQQANW